MSLNINDSHENNNLIIAKKEVDIFPLTKHVETIILMTRA